MKNLLVPFFLLISFSVRSDFYTWKEAYSEDPKAEEISPIFNKNEVYFTSSNNSHSKKSTVIKGLKVEKIIDGDTVYGLLEGKTYKIRLSEIDAPERSQPFGRQSKVYLRNLLEKGYFDAVISQQDQYGRYLARLYTDGIDINRAMVSGGMAWVYDLYVIDKTLYNNQNEAQQKKRGLWSKRHPAPPWEWRKARRK